VKAVGRKEGMRPPDLPFAMAVSPIGAHQAGNLCWETQKCRTRGFFFISLAPSRRSSSYANTNTRLRECLTVAYIILYFPLFFSGVVL